MRTREALTSTAQQTDTAQRKAQPNGKLQALAQDSPRMVAQRKLADAVQNSPRAGGLPAQLQAGIESLSGMSMDHVAVHYNSSRPAQLQAHAYAQGSQIHVGPGQEQHLPHEAWHVVQQAQGRVRPTLQMHGNVALNDNPQLEREADAMGARAVQMKSDGAAPLRQAPASASAPVQRYHMQDAAEGLFVAQEERDTHAGKTYLTDTGKANIRGRKRSTIRVADTGELAVEAAPGREAKIFYGTTAMQQASNKVLKSLNSPIRFGMNGSLTLPVTSKTGQHKLLRAYYPIDVKAKKLGDDVQVPERCNEAGPHILNTRNDNWLRVKLKTTGWAAHLNGMQTDEAGMRIMRHFQKRKEKTDLTAQYAQAPVGNFFRAMANPVAGWLMNTRHDAENERLAALDHEIAHPEAARYRKVLDGFSDSGAGAIAPYAQQSGTAAGLDLAREAGINEYANPEVGEMLSIRSNSADGDVRKAGGDTYVMNHATGAEIKNPFPYHYASVIAKSGGDYVTMENYARREGGGPSALDPRYFFKMYGTLAQSFHAESQADYPAAMTFVYGKQKQEGRPTPEFDTDTPQFEGMQETYNRKLNEMSRS